MNKTKELLETYSILNDDEIAYLLDIEKSLSYISKLAKSDVFIDVRYLNEANMSIVVAEHLQEHALYKESVLGKHAYRNNEPAVLKTLDTGKACLNLKAITQEAKQIVQNVAPLIYQNKVIGVIIEERLSTKNEFNNHKIKVLNKELDIMTNILCSIVGIEDNGGHGLISEGVIIYNSAQNVVYYNEKARAIYEKLGFKEQLNKYNYDQLTLSKTSFNETSDNGEYIKAGDYFLLEKKHFHHSGEANCIVIIEDLTGMKHKDEEIIINRQSIREMHHRIKNNLQIIGSMLRIQSRMSDNKEISKALDNSIQRIVATSNVHEILSKKLDDEVSIDSVTTNLIKELKQYVSNVGKNIEIILKAPGFLLDSMRITVVCIVLNELIMNSIEHAFKKQSHGKIKVDINKDCDCIEINVSDDGSGYNPNQVEQGLGSNIVQAYVEDSLKGIIKVDSQNGGTSTIIRFNK